MGFESTTFLKLVQCSDYQLSYEATQLGEGQFFGSCVPVKGLLMKEINVQKVVIRLLAEKELLNIETISQTHEKPHHFYKEKSYNSYFLLIR